MPPRSVTYRRLDTTELGVPRCLLSVTVPILQLHVSAKCAAADSWSRWPKSARARAISVAGGARRVVRGTTPASPSKNACGRKSTPTDRCRRNAPTSGLAGSGPGTPSTGMGLSGLARRCESISGFITSSMGCWSARSRRGPTTIISAESADVAVRPISSRCRPGSTSYEVRVPPPTTPSRRIASTGTRSMRRTRGFGGTGRVVFVGHAGRFGSDGMTSSGDARSHKSIRAPLILPPTSEPVVAGLDAWRASA